jgi:hypothetical protein
MTATGDKLALGPTKLQLNPGSVTRSWELRVMQQYPGTKSVTLKQDSEGSWSGTATDDKGRRYSISIKAAPEEPGKERQYHFSRVPIME